MGIRDVNELVNLYFDQIEVENTDFVQIPDGKSDAAYLLLNIPTQMLKDYLKLKNQNKKFPDATEFWKETNLGKRLRNSDKYHGQGHEPLNDILDFLEGDVQGDYQKLKSLDRIRLDVTELVEIIDS